MHLWRVGFLLLSCGTDVSNDGASPCGIAGPPFTADALVVVDTGFGSAGPTVRLEARRAFRCPPGVTRDVAVSLTPPFVGPPSYPPDLPVLTPLSFEDVSASNVSPLSVRIVYRELDGAKRSSSTTCTFTPSNGAFACHLD